MSKKISTLTLELNFQFYMKITKPSGLTLSTNHRKNILCGIIYRYPRGKISHFMEYLNSTTKKIHMERKYCVLMGDFNIDLLKYDQHQVTDDFINTLGAYFSNLIFFNPLVSLNIML